MITQTAKYAIRALIHLAQQQGDGYCQTREIAQIIDVPANYLGKTLQKLAHARILDSQKGLHGGFRTSRPAEQITLYEVMVAIEAVPRDFTEEEQGNGKDLPSAVYSKFAEMSRVYGEFLKATSLADIADAKSDIAAPKEPALVHA